MPLEKRVSYSDPSKNRISPAIEVSGMTVAVAASTIRYNGQDYPLNETTYHASKSPTELHVTGTLLKRIKDNEMWVYFQEATEAAATDYDRNENSFVHTLLFFTLPANAKSLENITMVVMTIE